MHQINGGNRKYSTLLASLVHMCMSRNTNKGKMSIMK